jgi:hypothetical protein
MAAADRPDLRSARRRPSPGDNDRPQAQASEMTVLPSAGLAGTIALGGVVPVNRLGFGAMRLPGVWEEPRDPGQAHRLLRRAIDLGVNLIDTAHAYGPETSERLIAEALYPYPQGLIVATKAGYGPRGSRGWAPDGRPQTIRRHCRRASSCCGPSGSTCCSCTPSTRSRTATTSPTGHPTTCWRPVSGPGSPSCPGPRSVPAPDLARPDVGHDRPPPPPATGACWAATSAGTRGSPRATPSG